MKKEVCVISLGGSVIVPKEIDVFFLKELKKSIEDYIDIYKFIIVTGGGHTAREYIQAASKISNISDSDKDWLGIYATRMNAHLLRTALKDISFERIIKEPNEKVDFKNVLVASGWKPGFSTDYDAVILAKTYGAKMVVNITNVDYLYDKNPNEYKDAKRIDKIDWKGFRKIVGDKWIPGMNVPFDPIATKEAEKLKLKLVLIGSDIDNFRRFLDKKEFKGSIVG